MLYLLAARHHTTSRREKPLEYFYFNKCLIIGFADHTPLSVGRKLTTFARASSYLLNKKLELVVFHKP